MRKYCFFKDPVDGIQKIMMHQEDNSIYLFLYDTAGDKPCVSDLFFDSLIDAESFIVEEFGNELNWILIDDPLPGCQQDFISPTWVKERANGKQQWGSFERLVNGSWIEVNN